MNRETAASLQNPRRIYGATAIVLLYLCTGCGRAPAGGTPQSNVASPPATAPAAASPQQSGSTPATTSAAAPTTTPTAEPASEQTPASAPTSATAASIKRATAVLDAYRSAAGGAVVSSVRTLEVIGATESSATRTTKILHCLAAYPTRFRQEETPGSGQPGARPLPGVATNGRGPVGVTSRGPASTAVIFGLDGDHGWMSGARLAGAHDAKSMAHDVTVVARQNLVNFMAGVLPTWLLDGSRFTFTDDGVVEAGADRGAIILQIEGPDGHAGRLLMDATTHLPHRLTVDRQAAAGAAAVTLIVTYSDYRDVSGVLLPHKIIRETDTGITTTWSIAHYVVNGKVAPQAFLPPRKK